MSVKSSSLRFARAAFLLIGVVIGGESCRHPKSFEHSYTLIEVSLQAMPKKMGTSQIEMSLIAISRAQNKCLFKITHIGRGETTEEWVTVGELFRSAPWLGARGFRLTEIREDQVTVEKFGS